MAAPPTSLNLRSGLMAPTRAKQKLYFDRLNSFKFPNHYFRSYTSGICLRCRHHHWQRQSQRPSPQTIAMPAMACVESPTFFVLTGRFLTRKSFSSQNWVLFNLDWFWQLWFVRYFFHEGSFLARDLFGQCRTTTISEHFLRNVRHAEIQGHIGGPFGENLQTSGSISKNRAIFCPWFLIIIPDSNFIIVRICICWQTWPNLMAWLSWGYKHQNHGLTELYLRFIKTKSALEAG